LKQILQSLQSGDIVIEQVPAPKSHQGELLIQTKYSLLSSGTERMLLEFGKAGIIGKIRQQPDKVKQVLNKIKTDGLQPTLTAVKSKLEQPIPLGYCNVGKILETEAIPGFAVGDRVVSNGPHAEIVRVPKNLCVKIPQSVSDEHASFAILAAIGLQGIRLLKPTLGECIIVQGLGLIGLLTVQLLVAQGCRVLGVDYDSNRLELAKMFGAEVVDLSKNDDFLTRANHFSRGRGVDGVLITASTKSSAPVHQAAVACRKRGRIVLVGVTGLELSRDDFYKKELSFQVSCSYGPGRHDPAYEQEGHDYPYAYVRWTEQRNIEAVLDIMASGKLQIDPLISHIIDFDHAFDAYKMINDPTRLGLLLRYPDSVDTAHSIVMEGRNLAPSTLPENDFISIGFAGAGNYASKVLIPAFRKHSIRFTSIVSDKGISATIQAKKHHFQNAGTDFNVLASNPDINTIVITTRHHQHAQQVITALSKGKHVFVEKPLAMNQIELKQITQCYQTLGNKPLLMVGYNRRFAPLTQKIIDQLALRPAPISMIMTINAGAIDAGHWTQNPSIGGGRLLGEACHFVDLMRYFANSPITSAKLNLLQQPGDCQDTFTITLQFQDGSIGSIHYFANGHKRIPKERLEIFHNGTILQLDNFRRLTVIQSNGTKKKFRSSQNKGQDQMVSAFLTGIKTGTAPIAYDELIEVSQVMLDLQGQCS